ncbi:MAG: ATP-binding cassette domain-containing protein [Prevotella sp.]
MITDVILSGLTNLFALFGATRDIDTAYSTKTLNDYLCRHFGIRDTSIYTSLYEDLRDVYSMSGELDKDSIINQICENCAPLLKTEEQEMLLLRLMEFCTTDGDRLDHDDYVFMSVKRRFNVSDSLYDDFCHFIQENHSEHVTIQHHNGLSGHLTVMWMKEYNKLVFTYHGEEEVLMDDVPVLNGVFQTWTQSGVLKVKKSGVRIYYSTVFQAFASEYHYERIQFSGRDINFHFPDSINGIHNLSFNLASGQLVAIMGGSGAGKTTLLSLLNGTLKPQSGSITINGHSIEAPEVKTLIGFVPQDDLLISELTVYDNLMYTARLCFEGMSEEELDKRVTETLRQLGLLQTKDLKAGSPIEKTISGGQRKRLNIALELIREPAVLFLDEPTSGLSSTDTEKVINILKEQTFRGRLVIMNIHQPSSDVYKLFDRLWVLDKGGFPVFDGNPIDAVTYFKTAANYADADSSTCPTCGNVNPEVVLNIIEEKALDSRGQITDERKVSPQSWHKMYLAMRPEMEEPAELPIPSTDQRRPSGPRQFLIFLRRNIATKATNRQYKLIATLVTPALAAICAILTHYAPPEGYSLLENKNLVSYIFMSVIVATFVGMSGSAEDIIRDRLLLKRERFLRLSYPGYIMSKIVLMAFVVLFQTLTFVIIGNTIMGIHDIFGIWWGILFLAAFLSGLTGLLLSQCLSSVVSIYITIPILLIPQILLCGLVVDFSDLTPRSTTGNVPLVGDAIPSRWAYEALAVSQFTYNAYEKELYDTHKQKYETQYYRMAYLAEIQTQIETMRAEQERGETPKPERTGIIRNSLPRVAHFAGMHPYAGKYDYASLRSYTDSIESILSDRGNRATLQEDSIISARLSMMGKEEYRRLRRNHYNLQLENIVVNANSRHTHDIVNGHIVARAGHIFLTPQSKCGRAPFYSPVKTIGSIEIPTLWYNIIVMVIFSIITSVMLILDIPGRYVRKKG